MKIKNKVTFLFIIILSISSFAQAEKINLENGEIRPLIQNIENVEAKKSYSKAIRWINYNYTNADKVIGSNIENEMIRLTGISQNFTKSFGYNYDLKYTIKIEFKLGKYRLTVENLKSGHNGIFSNINLKDYYKSKGKPRKAYSRFLKGIERCLNNINISIYNFITNKKDDW